VPSNAEALQSILKGGFLLLQLSYTFLRKNKQISSSSVAHNIKLNLCLFGCHYTQRNDIQHDDIQYKGLIGDSINDAQHN
jgi:hypothetical protein